LHPPGTVPGSPRTRESKDNDAQSSGVIDHEEPFQTNRSSQHPPATVRRPPDRPDQENRKKEITLQCRGVDIDLPVSRIGERSTP